MSFNELKCSIKPLITKVDPKKEDIDIEILRNDINNMLDQDLLNQQNSNEQDN